MGLIKSLAAKFIGKRIAKELDLKEGPMDDKKKWYQSKGVWTGVVTVLIGAYETAKVTLAPSLGVALPDIPPFLYSVLGAVGVYSRVVANKTVS